MVVSSGLDFGEVQPSSTLQMSTAPTLDNPLSPIFQFSPCKGTKPLAHSVSDLIKYFVASFKCGVSSMLCSQIPCQLFKIAVMESGGHEFLQYVIANSLVSSLRSMKTLFTRGKHNFLYDLGKCLKVKFLECLLIKCHLVC